MRQANQNNQKAEHILPTEKSQAMNMLIRVTQKLIDLADQESQYLMQNDLVSFAILQDEKEMIAEQYTKASAEFRARVHLYRGVDKTLLNRLAALQKDLGEKSQSNNIAVTALYERSRASTQTVLLAAQEMGQKHHITYPQSALFGLNGEGQ